MLGALKKEKLLNSINLINETINTQIKMYFLRLFFIKPCYLKKRKKNPQVFQHINQ